MSKPLVLVVDDEAEFVETFSERLELRNLKVSKAFNGEEALQALEKNHDIEVVILDVKMPGMDGLATARHLKTDPVTRSIPVILLTAFGSLDTAVAAIRAGAYDFVTKPVELDLLAIAVERAVRHRDLEARVRVLREELSAANP